jgi:hypothetical protein
VYFDGVVLTKAQHDAMYAAFKQDGLLPLEIGATKKHTKLMVEVCGKAPFQGTVSQPVGSDFIEISGNSGNTDETHSRFGIWFRADGMAEAYLRDAAGIAHYARSEVDAVLFNQFHVYQVEFDFADFSNSVASIDGSTALINTWTGKTGSGEFNLRDTLIRFGGNLYEGTYPEFIKWIRIVAKP